MLFYNSVLICTTTNNYVNVRIYDRIIIITITIGLIKLLYIDRNVIIIIYLIVKNNILPKKHTALYGHYTVSMNSWSHVRVITRYLVKL